MDKKIGSGMMAALLAAGIAGCGGGAGTGFSRALTTPTPVAPISVLSFDPRAIPVASGQTPVASISATPLHDDSPLRVSFLAANLSRHSPQIVRYEWDFGDGNRASSAHVTHDYARPGVYTATLILTNSKGETGRSSRQIRVAGKRKGKA